MPTQFEIPGDGPPLGKALRYEASEPRLNAVLVLAHGAGAGQTHPFMVRYARGLSDRGLDVVTFNFPYMEARKHSPDRAPVLQEAFRRVVSAAGRQVRAKRFLIGGKSMGGRMATHLAAAPDEWPEDVALLAGVVVFGYPLNPPGGSRRSSDRVSHLKGMKVPSLIVQGTRDNFGGPGDIENAFKVAPGRVTVHAVEGGDHSLTVSKNPVKQEEGDRSVFDALIGWMKSLSSKP